MRQIAQQAVQRRQHGALRRIGFQLASADAAFIDFG